jgi:hypothetical protein
MDCGAAPGEYCAPMCQQDCKQEGHAAVWSTTGPKRNGDFVAEVVIKHLKGTRMLELPGPHKTIISATKAIAEYKREHGYLRACITEITIQRWRTKG